MLPSWASDVVTVIRAPLVDSRGSRVYDWDAAARHSIEGCSVQPAATSTDMTAARVAQAYDSIIAYLPAGADIQRGDRVEFRGGVYALNGDVMDWKSPTGALSHRIVYLRRWNG